MGTEQQSIPAPTAGAPQSGTPSGWDPYDVWRTRVFLPRLANEARARASLAVPVAAVHAIAPPLQRSRTTNRDGQGEPARETSANDDAALRHELINVLATLCLAGLAGVILQDSERGAAHTRVSIVSPTSR